MSVLRNFVFVVTVSFFLVGCEDDVSKFGSKPPVVDVGVITSSSGLGVKPGAVTLAPGTVRDVQFEAINGTPPYTWRVSRNNLGTISSSGLYMANDDAGENTITVTDSEGRSVQATVTQSARAFDELKISPASGELATDKSYELKFQATGGAPPYSWSVSSSSLGTINNSGLYTSKPVPGNNTVVVVDQNGSSASVNVNQTSVAVPELKITPGSGELSTDKAYELKFQATGGAPPYSWSVSSTSLGTINGSGLYTSKPVPGNNTVVVVDQNGSSASANVNQTSVAVPDLKITPSSGELSTDKAYELKFQATGGTPPYSWSVSSSSLGTVNNSGLYTSRPVPGNNTIVVTDGRGSVASASVRQNAVSVTSLRISPSSSTVQVDAFGKTVQFQASGGVPPYTWSVSISRLGTINGAGLYTLENSEGVNTISVRDSQGSIATATVDQRR